uniref:Ionotropic receptor 75a N-terminal domain-containing protein n=1 Tax=Timema monikensis TaxID=170555 RepID=A0A7R9HSW1_9NEOP|nr:unnamed protein product [Timema monikensis]
MSILAFILFLLFGIGEGLSHNQWREFMIRDVLLSNSRQAPASVVVAFICWDARAAVHLVRTLSESGLMISIHTPPELWTLMTLSHDPFTSFILDSSCDGSRQLLAQVGELWCPTLFVGAAVHLVRTLSESGLMISIHTPPELWTLMTLSHDPFTSFILDSSCDGSRQLLAQADRTRLFSPPRRWLILENTGYALDTEELLQTINNNNNNNTDTGLNNLSNTTHEKDEIWLKTNDTNEFGYSEKVKRNSSRDGCDVNCLKETLSLFDVFIDSQITISIRTANRSFVLAEVFKRGLGQPLVFSLLGHWTEGKGVQMTVPLAVSTRRINLHRTQINATMVILNNDTLNHLWDGYDIHIDPNTKLNIVLMYDSMNMMNASIGLTTAGLWGYATNGSWNGMVGYLQRNESEIGFTGLFTTVDRLRVLEYIAMTTPTRYWQRRCMKYIRDTILNNDTLNHLWDGYDIHIDPNTKLNIVLMYDSMNMMNASIGLTTAGLWGYATNGSWNGMVGYLQRNESEIGTSALFFTADRLVVLEYIAMTTPTSGCNSIPSPKGKWEDRKVASVSVSLATTMGSVGGTVPSVGLTSECLLGEEELILASLSIWPDYPYFLERVSFIDHIPTNIHSHPSPKGKWEDRKVASVSVSLATTMGSVGGTAPSVGLTSECLLGEKELILASLSIWPDYPYFLKRVKPPLSLVSNVFILPLSTGVWLSSSCLVVICGGLLYAALRWVEKTQQGKYIRELGDDKEVSWSDLTLISLDVCLQGEHMLRKYIRELGDDKEVSWSDLTLLSLDVCLQGEHILRKYIRELGDDKEVSLSDLTLLSLDVCLQGEHMLRKYIRELGEDKEVSWSDLTLLSLDVGLQCEHILRKYIRELGDDKEVSWSDLTLLSLDVCLQGEHILRKYIRELGDDKEVSWSDLTLLSLDVCLQGEHILRKYIRALRDDKEVSWSDLTLLSLDVCLQGEHILRKYIRELGDDKEVSWSDLTFLSLDVFLQGSTTESHGTPGRIISLLMFIAVMFLYTSYSANIVALLQSTTDSIRSLEDLLYGRLELGVDDNYVYRYYFQNATEPLRKAIYEKKIASPGVKPRFYSLKEGMERLRKDFFAFHVEESLAYKVMSETYTEDEKCGLGSIPGYLQVVDPWVAVRKDTPYKEMFKMCFRSRAFLSILFTSRVSRGESSFPPVQEFLFLLLFRFSHPVRQKSPTG